MHRAIVQYCSVTTENQTYDGGRSRERTTPFCRSVLRLEQRATTLNRREERGKGLRTYELRVFPSHSADPFASYNLQVSTFNDFFCFCQRRQCLLTNQLNFFVIFVYTVHRLMFRLVTYVVYAMI